MAEKTVTLVRTGELPQLNQLLEQIPETVLSMMRVPGLGPKKAAAIHKELGITTLDELREACEAGKVRGLKGFGAKTEQTILDGIGIAEAANQRIYWADADEIATRLREYLSGVPGIQPLELAGSYRRGKETVGDLDILAVAEDVDAVMDRFAAFEGVSDVLVRGETKMSVRLKQGLQIDLRIVPEESFGAALQYFTGSKEHNVVLRGMAKQRGLKINEYGVYHVSDEGEETYVAGASEVDVYGALELPWIAPELRESRHEFDWAKEDGLPAIDHGGGRGGDLHMHTTATDGKASLRGDGRRGSRTRIAVHRDHGPLATRLDGRRAGSETASETMARSRCVERRTRRQLSRVEGHRMRYPREGRHGSAGRCAGRSGLGSRKRALWPAAIETADYRPPVGSDRESARVRDRPSHGPVDQSAGGLRHGPGGRV